MVTRTASWIAFAIVTLASGTGCSRSPQRESLVLDLGAPSLAGLVVGKRVEPMSPQTMSDLGLITRSEGPEEPPYAYAHIANAFEIGCSDTVDWILVRWNDPSIARNNPLAKGLGHSTFDGRIELDGEEIPIGGSTTEAEFVARFGAPYWRDEDEDEILLFYEFGPVEWQVEFPGGGTLGVFTITTDRVMADPGNREGYGVDAPWPPPPRSPGTQAPTEPR